MGFVGEGAGTAAKKGSHGPRENKSQFRGALGKQVVTCGIQKDRWKKVCSGTKGQILPILEGGKTLANNLCPRQFQRAQREEF